MDANASPTAEDSVLVLDRINQTLEGLRDDGLIPFDIDADAIPAPYMIPLARLVAPSLLTAFGMTDKLGAFATLA